MRTFPRHIPPDSPRGDYAAYCAYCGAKFHRSELRLDAGNRLYCPQEGDGLDDVALDELEAATELPYEEPVSEELHHIPRDEYDQPPVITTDIEDESVEIGGTATFTVVATGDNLSYRWRRRSADADYEVVAGETTATYDFVAAEEHDADRVQVEVYNDSGRTVSRSAYLVVDFGSPVEIDPTATFWVEADRGDTVLNGGNVATLVDQIGGYDLTAAGGAQPLYEATGVNGRPSIRGASGKVLTNAGTLHASGNFTLIFCYDLVSLAGAADYIMWSPTDLVGLFIGGGGVGNKVGFFDGATVVVCPNAVSAGKHVVTLIKNGTTYTVRVNGPTNSASGTLANVQLRNLEFLARSGFSIADVRWTGSVYSPSVLSGATLSAAEGRWASKYGVTLA